MTINGMIPLAQCLHDHKWNDPSCTVFDSGTLNGYKKATNPR